MSRESIKSYEQRIEELESALNQAIERERYYKAIAKKAGRKRLLETRELSQLVSKYRASQEMLAANSEKLEELVRERTDALEQTNAKLQHTVLDQKRIQNQLERIVEFERAILEISSDFINQPIDQIDMGIVRALERIGQFSGADRISLNIIAPTGDTVLSTHGWKKPGWEVEADDFHDQYFHIYLEKLRKKKEIVISTVADLKKFLPKSASEFDSELFHPLLIIPMMQHGAVYGALFLYGQAGQITDWPEELITFIKILSDVFVNAIERKMAGLAQRESEEQYRDLVEKAGLAITVEAADGSFQYFNKRFAELFGYSEKQIVQLGINDLIHPDDRELVIRNHNNRFRNIKSPNRYEFRGVRKDGEIIYLEVDVAGIKTNDQIIATRSYIWDISHRVQAARAMQASEERYRNLVENFLDIVVIVDLSGDILYANPAFERQLGFSPHSLTSMKKKLGLFPDKAQNIKNIFRDFFNSDKSHSEPFENQLYAKDGSIMFHSIIMSKIDYADKPALQIIAHNITDQKNAEQALKKSAAFERTVAEIMSHFVGTEISDSSIQKALEAIGTWSNAGRVTVYQYGENGRFLTSLYEWCAKGVAPQIHNRQQVHIKYYETWNHIIDEHQFIHISNVGTLPENLAKEPIIAASNDIQSFLFMPFRVRNKPFGAISLEDTHMTQRWAEEDINLLRLSSEIMSSAFERIEAEKMLRRSEEQYRTLFDSSNDEIYLHGFAENMLPDHFINVNKAACEKLGYSKEELLRMNVLDIDAHAEHNKINAHSKRIMTQKNFIFETVHVTKSGEEYPVEVSAHLIEIEGRSVVLSIARDTTERKRIEEEVQKSQRLESIGVLAGGIAHDFNNLLAIILGNAQLARMMSAQNKDISKFLQNIEQGSAQASTLTRQLLTFSRGGEPIRQVQDLKELIKNAVALALSGLDEYADFDFSNDLYNAKVDKGQIHQVIHNLILNSDQAMPNGGCIEVKARNVSAPDAQRLQASVPGPFVHIQIKDHGIGISRSNLQKIFDPYFTTKKNGTGLGLTVVYSIIKKHDGLLHLDSAPGKGTTVDIYLPAVVEMHDMTSAAKVSKESYTGSAFVMDDDELVLDLAETMLKELGFRVKLAHHGEELLRLYKNAGKNNQKPDIIIMDLTIPAGMGGVETIKALKELDPNIKAIVSSGYSNDRVMSHYQEYGFAGIMAKPFTIDDLGKAIAKVLKDSPNS